ncbi:MAG: class I SAM-dependent DNA methyltransferase, partial [Planctomycetes bacterium]|nr:class I SAM-dependent DNA methyltransferase [Planctomycetota bacterium]
PLAPFHWEIEFPEVFSRENSGFDAFVGNPPFMGGKNISGAYGDAYLDSLKMSFTNTGGQADLVAYFFRACFGNLRIGGSFGLLATNTISQGDTRRAGLYSIRTNDGYIYNAIRRMNWPGQAAVIVAVVHVVKGREPRTYVLDRRRVPKITAFLFHSGPDDDPVSLAESSNIAFTGEYPYGTGFLFSPDGKDCTTVDEMEVLIQHDSRNADRIRPYLGGAEMLSDPRQQPNRHVIDFGDMNEDEARRWPDLFAILEQKVKPERMRLKDNADGKRLKQSWWLWCRTRPALREAREHYDKVLMHAFPSSHFAFSFIPTSVVIASPHPVFATDSFRMFAIMQSRVHEIWVRFFASSLKDDLRYTPSDCFDNFPFPRGNSRSDKLEDLGTRYYEFRCKVMTDQQEGLTKTYNRFHDPHEKSSEIAHLRELHEAMDRAVLEAYGWDKLAKDARCEFLLDYEEEDDDLANASGYDGGNPNPKRKRGKKKPWRLRWPDEFRDDVLARLLELNEQRAEEERLAGLHAEDGKRQPAPKRRGRKKPAAGQTELFG